MNILRVGIVGAGRMGRIRALSADRHPRCEVAGVSDTNMQQAESLAAEFGCMATPDWTELVGRDDIDAIVVATPPKYLSAVSAAALYARKHVLCEKPGACTAPEMEEVLRALYGSWPPANPGSTLLADKNVGPKMMMGFTLRHHPAVGRARKLLKAGEIGRPMYIVGRYGHGGRPGYEKEWRGKRDLAGGGELLDQGVHLIDLSRWFLGEFEEVTGFVGTYFWRPDPSAAADALEDNAFLLLRSSEGPVASLQASWTQWKNLFSLEVYGETGFLKVGGLGGSYGEEELQVGRRNPLGGPPEIKQIALSRDAVGKTKSDVWTTEWQSFVNTVLGVDHTSGIEPASALDAWQALRIVEAAYEASHAGATMPLRRMAATASSALSLNAPATTGRIQEKNDSV